MKSFLGEGGKKRVYLAHDSRLDRDVAIGVIKTEGLDAEGLTRVRREAQAMGRLGDNPHIVTVLDIPEEDGQPYIVMEHMDGGSLEDLLQQAESHRLAIDEGLRLASQVCQALEHAHERGIIHRDVKPGNIWLTQGGTAKLGDFGLAVALDRSRLTREGMMVGTTSYMPPEQALGGEVTPRSDLYALGCLLYEMVAGQPPFLGGDSVAVISQHINTAPVAPTWHNPEVPKPLDALIMRLLAKAPKERPESAAAVAKELQRISQLSTEEAVAAPAAGSDLQGVAWGQFVGREAEMEQLTGALENALSGQGSLVMLVGEPGIGKTRLAQEFAVYASLRGAQVLTGHCYEGEVSLPYRPFIEAFRQYARSRPDAELRGELSDGAPEVAKLVSEIRQRFPDIPEAPPLEADAERLRLFESVSAFVCSAAQSTPIVLFLDDIHWADKPSLLMLRYLARATTGERVLILGAYRDVELDRTHPLSDVIATLRREQPYQRVLLRGLPEDDVLAMLKTVEASEESAAGRQALATALYQETEGNPFFVREVISHLIEEGKLYRQDGRWTTNVTSVSELGIPEGVREVVGKRLSRVSEECNRMLTLASTMTGGFSWEELKAISGESEAALLDMWDEALSHQLVAERKGDLSGTYDFTHALIRQTLYGELSTPRRVVLHRQIGQALEELHADNLEGHLSELAHHFYQAAPGGDIDKAIGYATRAGDRAVEQLAHEEAAAQYELALQALDLKDKPDERRRYELLMALGGAYFRADVPNNAMATLKQAAAVGQRLGDGELHGEAAVRYADSVSRGPFVGTQAAVPLLEEALAAEQSPALRSRLLSSISLALEELGGAIGPRERRLELAQEAKTLAEGAGDAGALAGALNALYYAMAGPERTEERLVVVTELITAAEQAGDRAQIVWGHLHRVTALAELGAMEELRNEIGATSDLADELREPAFSGWRYLWEAMYALREGRFEEAEQSTLQVAPIAQRMQHTGYIGAVAAQFFALRWAQGRIGELEGVVTQQLQGNPDLRAWQAALVVLYLDIDREDDARDWFDRLAANDFLDIPRDVNWIVTLGLASNAAYQLRDRERAAQLYEIFLPYATRQVVVGAAFLCDGSGSLALGEAAAALERWEDAERHFEEAIAFAERTDTRPWAARAQLLYAQMLRDRDNGGDREKAQGLVNQALAVFEQLGMKKYVERALGLKMELQGVAYVDIKTSIDAVASAVQTEQPNLPSKTVAPDGTVTLLFTDIEGSTPLNEQLGDQRWMTLLREHNGLVREQLRAHDGYEVKTEGDGFMVAFGSARKALQCAIAVQRTFAAHDWGYRATDGSIRVRIGIHTGEMIQDAGDFYGKHVNLAARIASEAKGGEILVSSLLRELTESGGDIAFGDGREVVLKGLTGTQRVYKVGWQ